MEYCQPISDAMWRNDITLPQSEIARGRNAIAKGTIGGQEAGCLAAQLNFMDYQLASLKTQLTPKKDKDVSRVHQLLEIIQTTLLPQENSRESETYQFQIRLFLMACCAIRNELNPLNEPTFRAWFAQLEKKYQDTEFWTYVSFWAYDNDILDLLEQAYDYLLLIGSGFYSEYAFSRVELMVKLQRRLATEEDLLDLMKLSKVRRQLKSVKYLYFQKASLQGLWSPEVDKFYEDFLLELSHNKSSRAQRLINTDNRH